MATAEDKSVNIFLHEAQIRGGGWGVAMRMMARRIIALEDRLLLLDRSIPGGLADDAATYVISESSAIAASIVASGTY